MAHESSIPPVCPLHGPIAWPAFAPGTVWIVGAGPGDAGLLTLYAHYALGKADVVVYDALVSHSVLSLARPGAKRIYAGKRGGRPSARQRDISRKLVELAKRGLRVLRLKGGDPLVFGRGGEEALALVGAGIPFRIVPGISAGIGGLAYSGIPLTHRDTNHVVTFVTGHTAQGERAEDLDWQAIARASPVIVIYMGLKHLGGMAQSLINAGRSADEPVAVVSHATLPDQRVLETTLREVSDAAQAMDTPAIIVVGPVVRMRAGLDWLGALCEGRLLDADPLGRFVRLAAAS
jgi:uroporphyrin-III C-methyltransferase